MTVDLRTSDLDEFRQVVGTIFCPFSLTPGAKEPYDARLHHRPLGALSFSHIAYDHPVVIEAPPLFPVFLIQIPLRGSFQGQTTGAPHNISAEWAYLTPPRLPLKMHCPAAIDLLVVSMDPVEIAEASALGGEEDRLLSLPEPLSLTGPGASLAHCIRFLHTESMRADTRMIGEGVSRYSKQMLYALLLETAGGKSQPAMPRPWYIKRAEEFMAANLGVDIGIADVAASASISMRALQYGFQNVHGVPPMVWLKQRRLDRVRSDLIAADPAETTVTDVAFRWGFVHLGRFAADYCARFGELPSVTLHR